jgi:hypothetical protein
VASSIVIAGFDEVRFPEKLEFEIQGGPRWSTTVTVTASGFEQRNQNWENARRRFAATFRQFPSDPFNDWEELLAFFNARRGRFRGFRLKDWTDFQAAQEVCTLYNDTSAVAADGIETEFQLAKLYDDANQSHNPYRRLIKKPVLESPDPDADSDDPAALVYLDIGSGPVLQDRNPAGDYSLDTSTGRVTFNVAPVLGAVVTWTGRFDVPVRFDSDDLRATLESFDHYSVPIEVLEVRIPQ